MPRDIQPTIQQILSKAILNAQGHKPLEQHDITIGKGEKGEILVMIIQDWGENRIDLVPVPHTGSYTDGAIIDGRVYLGERGKHMLYLQTFK